jgi:hypothetical protein
MGWVVTGSTGGFPTRREVRHRLKDLRRASAANQRLNMISKSP